MQIQLATVTDLASAEDGIRVYRTKALMNADLTPADATLARVTGDGSNNGVYLKTGAPGAGSWGAYAFDRVALVEGRVTALEGSAASPAPWYYPEFSVVGDDVAGVRRVLLLVSETGGEMFTTAGGVATRLVTAEASVASLFLTNAPVAPWYYPDFAVVADDVAGVRRTILAIEGGIQAFPTVSVPSLTPSGPTAWDVIAIAGQSNATNGPGTSGSAVVPTSGTAYYWTGSAFALLGATGGFWGSLAAAYYRATGRGVLLVPVAIASTSITTWAGSGNSSFDSAVTTINAALTAANADPLHPPAYGTTHRLGALVWLQGEQDQAMSQASYRTSFDAMTAGFFTTYGPNLRICLIGLALEGGTPITGPRDAQRAAQLADPRLFWGRYTNEDLAARSLMNADNTHYLQPAYNLIGESAGRSLALTPRWNL
jgi:hypothetical protein